MAEVKIISGDMACAYGAKVSRARVVAAYPITPQTIVVEKLSEFIANGEMDAEYIRVESEHSAASAVFGSEAAGLRSYTATSSQGLALMHEIVYAIAGARLPIGFSIVNRTLAAPINILAENNDIMAERDSGFIINFNDSNQEVLDSIIINYRVGEDKKVLLPQMNNLDAFILSHTFEPVEIPDQKKVDDFLPELDLEYKLDTEHPIAMAPLSDHRYTPEFRWNQDIAMREALKLIPKVMDEFYDIFGRRYGNGLVEKYKLDGAEVVLFAAGTNYSTGKAAVDDLREEGKPVGIVKIRSLRPFPVDDIREIAKNVDVIGVHDRSAIFGLGGEFYQEVKSALYGAKYQPTVLGFVAGLGGRDVRKDDIKKWFDTMLKVKKTGEIPENFRKPGDQWYDHVDVRK